MVVAAAAVATTNNAAFAEVDTPERPSVRTGRRPVVDDKYLVIADLMGEDDTNREEYNDREEFDNNDREEDTKGVSFLVEF